MEKLTFHERGHDFRDEYLALMELVFPKEASRRKAAAWDWMFANPMATPKNNTRLFVIERGGIPIGASIAMPGQFTVAGQSWDCMIPMSTLVHPDHRGVGMRLMKRYFDGHLAPLTWGLPNSDQLIKVYRRKGSLVSPPRTLRRRILRPGSALNTQRGLPDLATKALNAVGVPLAPLAALSSPRPKADERIDTVTAFGPDFDQAWARVEANIQCTPVRRADYLQWRYRDVPHLGYRCRALWRNGQLAGYTALCVQPVRNALAGRVTDIFVYDGATRDYALLLADADSYFRDKGCAYSEIVFGQSSNLEAATKQTGYLIRKPQRPFVIVHDDPEIMEKLGQCIVDFHLCRGDHDEDY